MSDFLGFIVEEHIRFFHRALSLMLYVVFCVLGRSVYLNIPFLIVMNILVSLVGLIIYAHYADVGCDPLKSRLISNSNQVCCLFFSQAYFLLM